MEPTFIATPYVQASSPSSRQIRAWLDEQEAEYVQWRSKRKPVKHTFASAKLNSPVKALSKVEKASSMPLWMTLSNQAAEKTSSARVPSNSPAANRKNSATPVQRQRTTSFMAVNSSQEATPEAAIIGRKSLRRSTIMSTPTLPTIQKGELTRQPTSLAGNGKSVRIVATPETHTRHVKTSTLAKKRLQEHLYDFHSRQVFSYAPSIEEEENQRDGEVDDQQQESLATQPKTANSSTTSSDPVKPTIVSHRRSVDVATMDAKQDNCILEGVSFMTSQHYAGIFEHDWRLSDVDRVVRDAVERNRIYTILKSSYRVLLWFFRFYAGKSGLASGVLHVHDLFVISSKTKLLEDLNVQCVDPAKYAITDTPLKRDGMVAFLLNVARMMSSHSANNPARLRVLAAEGIELSEAMKTLVRDHFGVYSQIQDVNHFRNVFLRKTTGTTNNKQPRRSRHLVELLNKHKLNLENFFKESVKVPATKETSGVSERHQRVSMTFTQFLSTLRALGLIANPSTSSATSATTTANAPTGIEEGRALRVFLSCLGMSEFDCMDRNPGISTRDATLEQFVEALLRIALMRKELSICQGEYDVCPGELTSDLCQCEPESVKYDFVAFDDAVEELLMVIHAFRLQQAHKRTVVKMQSLRSLQLNGKQNSVMHTTRLKLLATVESEDE
ncbi:hypothetical protein Gpo141_00009669 [Globisporangium polare]